ncbi:phosphoethanolamine transferase [Otariodibacter oris]|uniref:Glucan phosphoethanolaminetransferase (Alkaline phosphatase superfamily) n=1 Tax=Otariodibacter oris TaxID=1032623 RepID=A0A420XI82_9PAST|nr:sulfatase-like hydrolase/transferase [Otariodibacter oris]QGM80964.1 protein DcaA [Otariodibacter oris]RKR76858.1 glucan phosphoethanolaminetransferase (alkaline phosphatase superfamily) [Otariodibacter oris]
MKRNILILSLYSIILLSSEILYRYFFEITPLYRIGESFIIIFVLLSFYYFSKYKITQFFIVVFFISSTIFNNIHYEIYQNWINGTNYFLLIKEFSEVIQAGLSMIGKISGGVIWGFFDVIVFISIIYFRKQKHIVADSLFFISLIYIFARSFYTNQEFGITSNPGYSRIKSNYFSVGFFVGRVLPYNIFNLSNVTIYTRESPIVEREPTFKNIILIMGESASANNFSVFGYQRHTSPFLDKMKSEYSNVLIKKTYSSGLYTAVSLPALFNAIPRPNGLEQIVSGRTNIFKLAQAQKYKTYFYSSQPEKEMMIISIIGKTWIDDLRFPSNQGYKISEGMNDHNLLPLFEKIDLEQGNNFIVLHQRGSHTPYANYLTDEEKVFKEDTIVDKYDSTIYNTDLLIKKVFNYLENRKKDDWLLIYTSDHGQYVTNKTYNQGTVKEENYLVPIFIFTPNENSQENIYNKFSSCKRMFHQQLSTFIINSMGYDMPISDCHSGIINSKILTGDSGFLSIEDRSEPKFIFPKR